MRAVRAIGGMAAAAIAVIGSLDAVPSAHASSFGTELNGTYRVLSDGEWARTNEVYVDEQTVIETWTIATSCVSPTECSGEVTSDLGWTATARLDDLWYFERVIPNWMPCPDGTFADGYQKFVVWGVNPATNEERVTKNIQHFAGRNVTKSDSGACGVNKPKLIEMPVRIDKLS